MARLVWDKPGERFFEAGVDHGVLYPNGSEGVPWDGLISVEETVSGGEAEALYFDGIKYFDVVASEDFQATVQAFTYPDEFAICEGNDEIIPGMTFGYQPRQTFGMAWRTKLGNDLEGADLGYRLHILYNATASPSARSYETLGDSPSAINFSWEINAIPNLPGFDLIDRSGDPGDWVWPEGFGMTGWPNGPDGNTPVPGWRAFAYLYVDSNAFGLDGLDPSLLSDLENRLFGTSLTPAYLPSQLDMMGMLNGLDVPYSYPFDYTDPNAEPEPLPALPLVITEVFKGALDEFPDESIIPDGPDDLSDDSDATKVILSQDQAADWFLYFDTSYLSEESEEFVINFRTKTDLLNTVIRAEFFDGNATMDSVGGTPSSPPNSGSVYSFGHFDTLLDNGLTDHSFIINQDWLNTAGGDAWMAGVSGVKNYDNVVTAIKTKQYAIVQLRFYSGTNTDLEVTKATITQSRKASHILHATTVDSGTDVGLDAAPLADAYDGTSILLTRTLSDQSYLVAYFPAVPEATGIDWNSLTVRASADPTNLFPVKLIPAFSGSLGVGTQQWQELPPYPSAIPETAHTYHAIPYIEDGHPVLSPAGGDGSEGSEFIEALQTGDFRVWFRLDVLGPSAPGQVYHVEFYELSIAYHI